MRIMVIDFLPSYSKMRRVLICMTCFESIFDVYLLSCIIASKYTTVDCPVHPQMLTEIFMAFVIAPFFIIKLIAINCCMSP
jgi:hypothetical protein